MQQTDAKDGADMEEAALTEKNAAEFPAENPDLQTSDDQAGRQAPVDDGDSFPKGGTDADLNEETLVEWLDAVENDEFDGDDMPVEQDLDQEIPGHEAKTAELEAHLAEARDQLLRKAADFENFRKRMNQEKQNAIEFANQNLLLDIIPVIDDFERAIQSAEASQELTGLPAGKAMLDGITMIEKRLISQLEAKWGLRRFNSAGEPFDPNIHEAMLMDKSSDIEEPVVAEEFVKGYMLKDRVIRAAKVKVFMPAEEVTRD